MQEYYVNYYSLTKAQSAKLTLQKRGVDAALLRTPKALQENGCGYTLKMSEQAFRKARPLPKGHGRVYLRTTQGFEESAP